MKKIPEPEPPADAVRPPEPNKPSARSVREWANDHGYPVARRGRVPRLLVEEFLRQPENVRHRYTRASDSGLTRHEENK